MESLRREFDRDGVLVIRDFFSVEEAQALRGISDALGAEAADLLRRAKLEGKSPAQLASEDPKSLIVVPEGANPLQVCRFECILPRSEQLRKLVFARVLPIIEACGGEKYLPFKDKENEKHPGGGAFTPHQDFAAYQFFGPRYEITVGIPVDPNTKENGCLQFARNWKATVAGIPDAVIEVPTKDIPLLSYINGGPKNGDIREDITEKMEWYDAELGVRDLVLFDSFVPHRSFVNKSTESRRLLILTFAPARYGDWYQRYYQEKRRNYNDPKFHVSTPTNHSMVKAAVVGSPGPVKAMPAGRSHM